MELHSSILLYSDELLLLTLDEACDNIILTKDYIELDLNYRDDKNNWMSLSNKGKELIPSFNKWFNPKYYNSTFDIKCSDNLIQLLPEIKSCVDSIIFKRTYVTSLNNIQLHTLNQTIRKFLSTTDNYIINQHEITNYKNYDLIAYINLCITSSLPNDDYLYINISGNSIILSAKYTKNDFEFFFSTIKDFCKEIGNCHELDEKRDIDSFYISIQNAINLQCIQKYIPKLIYFYPTLDIESFDICAEIKYLI